MSFVVIDSRNEWLRAGKQKSCPYDVIDTSGSTAVRRLGPRERQEVVLVNFLITYDRRLPLARAPFLPRDPRNL